MALLNFKSGIDFTEYMSTRTPNFTGREWVFQKIYDWLSNPNASRYFLVTGEPGSGKTAIAQRLTQFSQSQESLYPDLLPSFLNAIHICSARDSTSVDPRNFCKSVALQLAEIQDYAIALANIDTKHVNIQATQNLGTVTNSTIQNVVINNLDVSGVMTAQEAFNLLVLNPLQYIYQNGFNQPITILVDALDEALTHEGKPSIVDLLSKLENLPPQIRFILTSRKESRIETKFLDTEELYLSASEFNQLNQHDVKKYIEKRFVQDEPLSVLVADLKPQQRKQSIEQIAEKSEGNFLYVSFLLNAIAKGQRSLCDLEGLPEGLDGLYYQSLERVIELGKQDWHETYAPFMGILSVARTSLTLSQLQAFTQQSESLVWKCLTDLRQFLEEVESTTKQEEEGNQYRLYHQSVVDFLRKRSLTLGKNTRHNPYYLPVQEFHQQITYHYWQPSQALETLDLHHLDSYAYNHLTYHLLEGDRKEELYCLLTSSPKWLEAKFIHCNGDASYAADLDLAINDFSDPLTASQLLILIQLHTARQVVGQRSNRYEDIDLRTLVWLGRETEAFNHVRLRTNAQKRFWGLFILYKLFCQRGQPYPSLLHELQETAYSIEELKARVAALGAVAHALAQVEGKGAAETIFAEARQLVFQIDNKSQQALALKELVVPLALAGYFLEAEETARAIEDRKWQAWSLATLGASLAQANQLEKSKTLFSESQEQALSLPDDHEQAWLLKAIAGAHIEAMNLDAAEAVAQIINNPQRRVEALSELGTALLKAGLGTKAKAVFTEAETLARFIDYDFQQGEALQALAEALVQSKQYTEAERVALTIEVDWAREKALLALSAELAQEEQFTEAERISDMMQNNSGRTFMLRVLALVHARTGNPTAATQFFKEAGAIAPVIEDDEKPVFALAALAMTLVEADYKILGEKVFQEALAAAKAIKNNTSRTSALRTLASKLAQHGCVLEAENLARAIDNPLERAWALKAIAISLAQKGCRAEAIKIFADIEDLADVVKNNRYQDFVVGHRDWVLGELSKALTEVGYFAEAERVALAIQDDNWKRTWALSELAKALANSEQFVEAQRITRAIPKTDWKRVDALGSVVVALVRAGDRANAKLLLAEARKVAESIEDSTWKAWALRALVTALTQIKHFVEAEEIAQAIADAEQRAWSLKELAIASAQPKHFIEAGKAAEAISSGIWRTGIFLSLAEALIQIGRHLEANEFFAAAQNAAWDEEPRYRESALKELAIVNAQVGCFTESRRIIKSMEYFRERDEALMTLARGLAQAQQFRDAKQAIQTIEEEKKRRWALGSLAIALAQQQHFSEALQEIRSQTLDEFIHILARCSPIFEQLEPGISLSAFKEVMRIVGWVRPDWRKVANYF
ncbi:NACHT domain-containing protein [Trichocoleus sp. DQ-A3]|uniref:NACHT domain-containing protein n=1 Tax=Cyanophyceae TaxID=3028117 RepID=UPI0016885795|nr:NACHT domain-containing protein [Coleofasciculus sp. FACHB-125]MBD1898909.1 NACHT domain-containing protein [Coleofasciculus sp. FACHB-125]